MPALPDCTVEADSRSKVVTQIKERIREVVKRTEVIQLDVPIGPKSAIENGLQQNSQPPWDLINLFKDDPTWDKLFDEIESERDANRCDAQPKAF